MTDSNYVTGFHFGGFDAKCKMIYVYRGNEILCTHEFHATDRILLDARRNLGQEVPVHEIRERFARSSQISVATEIRTVAVGDKHFAPTISGRAARGELEERVRQVFKKMLASGPHGELMIRTVGMQPGTIGTAINPERPPSDGAIYSILKKWSDRNQAELLEKPFRLVGFTARGRQELDI